MKAANISIDAAPGARVYAVLRGDIHIRQGTPVYQLEPAPIGRRPLPADIARHRTTSLLAAENQVVDFSGRTRELNELSQWRDGTRAGISTCLIHGPGGQGKSRLASEFASRSAGSGWTVWAAHHVSDAAGRSITTLDEPGTRLLVLIDYAERWPLDDLILMLGNTALRQSEHVRILLVARTADTWWPALQGALETLAVSDGGVLRLQPLAGTLADRRATFVAAYRSFADLLGVSPVPASTPTDRTLRGYELVLTTHMAALVAADARSRGAAAPTDPVGLSRYLLDREHDFWQTRYDHGHDMVADPVVMGRLVHTAILTRPVPRALGESIVVHLGVAPATEAAQSVREHAACYQPATQTRNTVLEPLYPDRLGEDFLALHSPGHNIADYAPDHWSQDVPSSLLDLDTPTERALTRNTLASLIEVARRWPHVAERQLYPLLRARPHIATSAGGAALVSLSAIPDVDLAVLAAVEAHLPSERSVDLDVGAASVVERLTANRLAHTDDPAERAGLHHELARRLSRAGRHEAAVEALEESVRLYRPLAQGQAHGPNATLAAALCDLAIALNKLARTEDALVAAQEAVGIRDDLATSGVAGRDTAAGMAQAKAVLAARLHDCGRWRAAVVPADEALQAYRELAENDPEYLPRVAAGLNNLGVWLSDLGDTAAALQRTEEALTVYRDLAASRPQTYLPDLAATLANQAVRLSETGRWAEGRAMAEEAVTAYRTLAETNPAYEVDLALTLNNLGVRLAEVGEHGRALAVTQESLSMRRHQYTQSPLATEPALAATLTNVGIRFGALGRHVEALPPTVEAVAMYRRLAERNPGRFEAHLSSALTNLAVRFARIGNNADAVAPVEESVAIRRRLAGRDAAAFEPGLAAALTTLGARLAAVGRAAEAIAASQEAAVVNRRLANANPGAFFPALAMALLNLSADLSDAARIPEAIAAGFESVEIRRVLARETPMRFTPDLARGLWRLATIRASTGDVTELRMARSELTEARTLYQLLDGDGRHLHADELAGVDLALNEVLQRLAVAGFA